ncbi:MAG: hypothetical protein QOH90_1732, partial [Actinomycetota bacterium]|nr:hypothetical protein [Actinomycetota bacterium]
MDDFESKLSAELKETRDRYVQSISAEVPAARERVLQRVRRRQSRFVITSTAVTAIALVAVLFVPQVRLSTRDDVPPAATSSPVIVATYDVPNSPVDIVANDDGAWVVTSDERMDVGSADREPNQFMSIDPASGKVSSIAVHREDMRIAANDENAFLADGSSLVRFSSDEAGGFHGKTVELQTGRVDQIAASFERVWAGLDDTYENTGGEDYFDGSLVYVYEADPLTRSAGQPRAFPAASIQQLATGSDGTAWAAMAGDGRDELWRIPDVPASEYHADFTELAESQSIPGIAVGSEETAVGGDDVWLARQGTAGGDVLTRVIFPAGYCSAACGSMVDLPQAHPPQIKNVPLSGITDVADGEGAVWATARDGGLGTSDLYRFDPESMETIGEPIHVGQGWSKIAIGAGYVWVTDYAEGKVYQIDPNGGSTPEPTPTAQPSTTPSPHDEATPDEGDIADCKNLPFAPTIGLKDDSSSGSIHLGSGAQMDVPLAAQES